MSPITPTASPCLGQCQWSTSSTCHRRHLYDWRCTDSISPVQSLYHSQSPSFKVLTPLPQQFSCTPYITVVRLETGSLVLPKRCTFTRPGIQHTAGWLPSNIFLTTTTPHMLAFTRDVAAPISSVADILAALAATPFAHRRLRKLAGLSDIGWMAS